MTGKKPALVVGAGGSAIAPAWFAVGAARDPRVPALQRRVAALEFRISRMWRATNYAASYGDKESEFESYISSLRSSCG